jgi:coenzyme F420-reducing hydrogenase delta subunit
MAEQKRIVAFCCENSALQAVEALQDHSVLEEVEIVSLPCTGKIEIIHILKSFEYGYEGVLVLGCPVDNCKYIKGNVRARKRVEMVKESLKAIGIEENRVHMEFLSSLDAHKLTWMIHDMKERIASPVNS